MSAMGAGRGTRLAAWLGALALLALHVAWAPRSTALRFGWLPDELLYRLGWMAAAALYLLWFCARVWTEED